MSLRTGFLATNVSNLIFKWETLWRYSEEMIDALSLSITVSTVKAKIHWNLCLLSISCPNGIQGNIEQETSYNLKQISKKKYQPI